MLLNELALATCACPCMRFVPRGSLSSPVLSDDIGMIAGGFAVSEFVPN